MSDTLEQCFRTCMQGCHAAGKSWIFPKISRIWKVLENEFGPGEYQKLKFKVLESPGMCMHCTCELVSGKMS